MSPACRPVRVTVTVTARDLDAVRDWLVEYVGAVPIDTTEALWAYVYTQLLSISDYDGVSVTLTREDRR